MTTRAPPPRWTRSPTSCSPVAPVRWRTRRHHPPYRLFSPRCSPMPDSAALIQAVADLHRAAFTGTVLATVARRGTSAAADLVFAVFRRQHHERFLPGLQKLGLAGLPHAVAAAQYHYLSNRIGGVSVEYMRETDGKAWIRYAPPRWLWHGTAICGIPGEVSRAMLRGWHAHNGVSLGNPRLGFVCTGQVADGDPCAGGLLRSNTTATWRRRNGCASRGDRQRRPSIPRWPHGSRPRPGRRSACVRRIATTPWSTCALPSPPRSTCSARLTRRRFWAWRYGRSGCSGMHLRQPRESLAAAQAISPHCWRRSPPRRATGQRFMGTAWNNPAGRLMRGAQDQHPAAIRLLERIVGRAACRPPSWAGTGGRAPPRPRRRRLRVVGPAAAACRAGLVIPARSPPRAPCAPT